jgi:hypothetical protein
MKINQIDEAVHFFMVNHEEVKTVEATILTAAQRFLEGPAKTVLPEEIIVEAQVALQRTAIEDFTLLIRGYAAGFVTKKISGQFWSMIDAGNFFMDATGSRWPYMTQEKRQISLHWAAEDAALV